MSQVKVPGGAVSRIEPPFNVGEHLLGVVSFRPSFAICVEPPASFLLARLGDLIFFVEAGNESSRKFGAFLAREGAAEIA